SSSASWLRHSRRRPTAPFESTRLRLHAHGPVDSGRDTPRGLVASPSEETVIPTRRAFSLSQATKLLRDLLRAAPRAAPSCAVDPIRESHLPPIGQPSR